MTFQNKKYALLTSVIASALAGCSSVKIDESTKEVEKQKNETERLKKQGETLTRKHATSVLIDDYYIVGNPYEMSKYDKLPDFFQEKVQFNSVTPKTLREILDEITQEKAMKFQVTNDAIQWLNGDVGAKKDENDENVGLDDNSSQESTNFSDQKTNADNSNSPAFPLMGKAPDKAKVKIFDTLSEGNNASLMEHAFSFKYQGTLEGALDLVVQKFDLHWKYESNKVVIFKKEFETYMFDGNNSSSTSKSELVTDTSGESASTGFSSTKQTLRNAFYDEIKNALEGMITKGYGSLNINTNTGIVSVDDIPSVHKNVKKYIDKMNSIVNKKVLIKAHVVEIDTDDNGNYGTDFQLAYSGSDVGLAFNPIETLLDSNLGLNVLGTNLAGSTVSVELFNQIKRVAKVTDYVISTQNGQSVPFQVVDKTTYISKVEKTEKDGQVTVSVDVDKVMPGFSMDISPKITSKNELNVNLAMNLAHLSGFDTQSIDDLTMKMPDEDIQSFNQNLNIKNGQTVMITGFEHRTNNSTIKSMAGDSFWALGGSKKGGNRKKMTIILLTPYIMAN